MSKIILTWAGSCLAVAAISACSGSGSAPASANAGGKSQTAPATGGSTAMAAGGNSGGGAAGKLGVEQANAGNAPGGRAGAGGTPGNGGQATGNGGQATGNGGQATGNGGQATGSGGQATGGAMPGAGGADNFVLSWQDDFNALDTSVWELENFTYDGNQAQFAPQNATVANGELTIALTAVSGAAKPYVGVEMRSAKTITYGKVSARMRFATGSGVVSGLVLFYTPFPNCDWNEIDIEHLGKSSDSSQFNAMVYVGTQVPSCTTSVTPTQDPLISNLGFNAETGYHLYDVEWTPAGVKYIADGVVLRTWTNRIALLTRPMNILLTIWASSAADWAGTLTATTAPTSAQVDWIKVYDLKR